MVQRLSGRINLLSANAPGEIRLFVFGDNETTKGTFALDEDGATRILAAFEAYGNDLVIDYEHQTFEQRGGGPSPAAGWIRQGGLSVKGDGLWAKVEWTEDAKALIKKKQYRYFSPSFEVDGDGRIVSLLPPALVNYPATIAMNPLAAKAMSLAEASGAKVQTLIFDKTVFDTPQKALDWAASHGYLSDKVDDTDDSYRIRQMDPEMFDPESLGTIDITEGVKAVVGRMKDAPAALEPKADEETMPMKNVLSALKLKSDASEADALVAVGKLTARETEILALTGRASMSEAVGVLAAWKDSAAKTVKLSAELAELEKAAKQKEAETLLDAAIAAHKVIPALRDNLLTKGVEDLAWLKAHLETLPADAVAHTKAHTQPSKAAAAGGMSDVEREICKNTNTKHSQFIEWRAKRAEG